MSCIFRIKENMYTFTDTEKRIAEYILEHREEVINLSSQNFAKCVDSSAAAIVRFSKKIGYNGFTHLKVELARDHTDEEESFDELIKQDDSYESLVRKAHFNNHRTFVNTYKLLNVTILAHAIEALQTARRIYLIGIGGSGVVCLDLFHKFIRIDKEVIYQTDYHLQMSALTHVTPEDVTVAVSYSGQTREVVAAQKLAYERGATTIAITQVGKNDLSKYSKLTLNIPQEEREFRLGSIASRFAMLALSDLLYLGVAKQDMTATKAKIIDTRDVIKSIRNI